MKVIEKQLNLLEVQFETKNKLIEKGRVISTLTIQNDIQKYWKRYNKQENLEMNKYNYRADWYKNKFGVNLEHGMAIEHVL